MCDLLISGPVQAADVVRLCADVRARLAADAAAVLVCEVAASSAPDAATVDALARLQLTARRHGGEVRLRRPSPELLELLELFGLAGVLPLLRGEPLGQAEERKQARRVEERVERGDATA